MNKKTLLYLGLGSLIGATALAVIIRKVLVKYRVVKIAKDEWEGWNKPLIGIDGKVKNKGGSEANRGYAERVGEYWRIGTGQPYDGRDTDVAWSSAFISYIMKKAGAGNKFVYNASHSKYITDSIANRKNGKYNEAFVGYKINEIAPKIGDLVCYSRQSGVDYDTKGSYKSHCDLVVKKSKNQLELIGGNVSQAVTKRIVSVDSKGMITDKNKDWFAVIKTNI
jgi:hypothetical protein